MHGVEKNEVYRRFIERTRLGRNHQLFLYGVLGLLWLSGAAWLLVHYFSSHEGEFGPVTPPMEPLALKVHGAAAIAFTLVLGSLIPVHMRRGWVLKRNRLSGALIVGTCAALVLSGWGLYYLAGEQTRAGLSLFHWVTGLALPALLYLHILAWRWTRQSA